MALVVVPTFPFFLVTGAIRFGAPRSGRAGSAFRTRARCRRRAAKGRREGTASRGTPQSRAAPRGSPPRRFLRARRELGDRWPDASRSASRTRACCSLSLPRSPPMSTTSSLFRSCNCSFDFSCAATGFSLRVLAALSNARPLRRVCSAPPTPPSARAWCRAAERGFLPWSCRISARKAARCRRSTAFTSLNHVAASTCRARRRAPPPAGASFAAPRRATCPRRREPRNPEVLRGSAGAASPSRTATACRRAERVGRMPRAAALVSSTATRRSTAFSCDVRVAVSTLRMPEFSDRNACSPSSTVSWLPSAAYLRSSRVTLAASARFCRFRRAMDALSLRFCEVNVLFVRSSPLRVAVPRRLRLESLVRRGQLVDGCLLGRHRSGGVAVLLDQILLLPS